MNRGNDLQAFVERISSIYDADQDFSIISARKIIKEINEFLYTTYDGIGMVKALGNEYQFLSEFHRYWNDNYAEILNAKICDEKCALVADALYDIYRRSGGEAFSGVYDTYGLSDEEVCRVRMLTANQDFRGSRDFKDLVEVFKSDNSIFDLKFINEEPELFLKSIDVGSLSQNDKRIPYAKAISKMLIELGVSPYELIEYYDRDIYALRNALIAYSGAGYGNKKADMFVRDMVVLGVWDNVRNFEMIDVASDINTIKVALRTGILSTEIPLVSSFLDIFCNQYAHIDEMTARAWRRVWEIFVDKYPGTNIVSPCLFDYFVYNVVGRQFCKENLFIFRGEECGHTFSWHSSRNKVCQVCYKQHGVRKAANITKRLFACEHADGKLAMCKTDFYEREMCSPNVEECPFKNICNSTGSVRLQPPKSISILGKTGWTDAYANKGEGGGGLMA
ncbi:MAG: hypothetical protein IJE49_01475 [Agathobacter sp.]|nr:hypothetical protein [Agathobacter sp.]